MAGERSRLRGADLADVAALAGHALSAAELEEVAGILRGMMDDIQVLRDLDLPEDVEPILTFRVEPWP
jgi:hypothetical protein